MFEKLANIIKKRYYTFGGKNVFFNAIETNNDFGFYKLLDKIDLKCIGVEGLPCLSYAVYFNRYDFVRAMLARGAEVNIQVDHHINKTKTMTPIMIAASFGELDMVKLLLSYGADPYITHTKTKLASRAVSAIDYAKTNGFSELSHYMATYMLSQDERKLLDAELKNATNNSQSLAKHQKI